MTEKQLRAKVVNQAKSWLGCKESNGSHKKIIDVYNSHKPLARNYKLKYTDAWCAGYVSAVAIKCDLVSIMPTEVGCSKMIDLYKAMGRWMEADDYVPTVGDIIMYDWDDSGKGDNKNTPDHVGIVVSVTDKTIKVIEGNYRNAVGYRNLEVNGKYIRGYCLPDYASLATEAEEAAPVVDDSSYPLGQFVRDIQEACGAAVDGVVGAETLGKAVTLSRYRNRHHKAVKAVQKRLYALGYTEVGEADGVAGKLFQRAVKAYQADNGCEADGEITKGHKTWKKLLGVL